MKRYNIHLPDGALSINRWDPSDKKPKLLVLILHGMMEHSLRYEQLAHRLSGMGILVMVPDLIGWGESTNIKCPLGSLPDSGWGAYMTHLKGIMAHLSDSERELPLFVIGHSMGSFVGLHALKNKIIHPQGLVCIGSTMIKKGPRVSFGRFLAKCLSLIQGPHRPSAILHSLVFAGFNKSFEPVSSDFDWLSSDKTQNQHYLRDVLCGQIASHRFFDEMLSAVSDLSDPRFISELPNLVPILFVTGDQDPLSDGGKKIDQLITIYQESGIQSVSHIKVPKQRHALLNDTDAKQTLSKIIRWMVAQTRVGSNR